MASISLTTQVSAGGDSARLDGTVAVKTPAPQPKSASLSRDQVKLSVAAQVKMMHHQGLNPTVIAAQMGIPVSQVNSYLPGATSAAPAAPAAQHPAASDTDAAPAAAKATAVPANVVPPTASAPKANA